MEASASSRARAIAGPLLRVAGVLTLGVACFHIAALVWPGISDPSPPWRHALFVLVNAFFGWAYLRRASWLPIPFAALFLQQLASHGSDLIDARAHGQTDVQSVLVLVSLPVLALLVWLGRDEPDAGRRASPALDR